MKKQRIAYLIAFLVLLAVEVFIAVFVHDSFVRPYIGDVLVVIVIYMLLRVFIPRKVQLLPLYVFLFAAGVEFLQLFHIVELLHVENISFLRVLIGSVFDWKDIICYAVGCLILFVFQELLMVKKKTEK